MKKGYMIVESVGPSIYERNTLPFVYMKREWAEYQLNILENDDYRDGKLEIREVIIVSEGPK